MQLQVFTDVGNVGAVSQALDQSGLDVALYLDAHDPYGIGIVFLAESPDLFVTDIRALLNSDPFSACTRRPELTMLGRTYATGL